MIISNGSEMNPGERKMTEGKRQIAARGKPAKDLKSIIRTVPDFPKAGINFMILLLF